jgi:hypothetical protein
MSNISEPAELLEKMPRILEIESGRDGGLTPIARAMLPIQNAGA